jgi:ribonuclease HII
MANQAPTFVEEKTQRRLGHRLVAGIDEVGRGPLAGPVLAAAVILSLDRRPSWLRFVRDSKQLTPRRRDLLFDCIRRDAVAFGVGTVSSEVIDEQGIVSATKAAMIAAVERLPVSPDFLLIDAVGLPALNLPQRSIIKGDTLSLSIAAASIVAKVTRDRLMAELDGLFPGYGLARNKGYGTPQHLERLRRLGPCPLHRKTFFPVRELLG